MRRSVLIGLVLALVLSLLPATGMPETVEASGCAAIHFVAAGETLASIAAHYGIDAHALAAANGITNPDWIYVGMRICIPGQPPRPRPPQPPPGQCVYHRVRPGQTLSGIARYYSVNMWTLVRRNGIRNPNRIYVGQILLIYCPAPPPRPPYYPPPPQPGDPHPTCSIMPVLGFGRVWANHANVRQKLGCPTAQERGFNASEQAFYSGYVVQDNDSKTIYVLFGDGTWAQHPDTWQTGDPINNPYLVPPAGWYQPEYGIGKLWRNEDNYSQRLGWARYPQRSVTASRQTFEHGLMLWTSSRGIFVLYNDGTWQRFD